MSRHYWNDLRFRLWGKLWLVVAGAVIGGIAGAIWLFFIPPQYQARASLIADSRTVDQQEQRMRSRDVLLRTVEAMSPDRIEYSWPQGLRGNRDLYGINPFRVELQSFPTHLQNQEIEVVLRSLEAYTLTLKDAEGGRLEFEGTCGTPLEYGAISLVLDTTKWYKASWLGESLSFQVNSEAQALAQYQGRMQINRLFERPNVLELYFTHPNERRTLDFVKHFIAVSMQDFEDRRNRSVKELLADVDGQIDEMMQRIRSNQA
ncbi:MAG: Wzz/FepE/Etk N-terminal domain-containing protein, partial [Bacteroidota bacterium]